MSIPDYVPIDIEDRIQTISPRVPLSMTPIQSATASTLSMLVHRLQQFHHTPPPPFIASLQHAQAVTVVTKGGCRTRVLGPDMPTSNIDVVTLAPAMTTYVPRSVHHLSALCSGPGSLVAVNDKWRFGRKRRLEVGHMQHLSSSRNNHLLEAVFRGGRRLGQSTVFP